MGWTGAAAAVLAVGLACLRGQHASPSTSDPGGTGERISGNERLGWNQAAADAGELATFRYAAYVDGNRVELDRRELHGPAAGRLRAAAGMPAMSPGAHTIELASFVTDGATVAERAGLPPCA